MLCPSCQHRNAEENRFCGHCGCDLTKYRTIYPREGYDEKDLPPVSEVDSEVPRFHRNGPPLAASEYGPPPEPPVRTPVATDVEPAASLERAASLRPAEKGAPEPRDMHSYGSSTGILFNLDPKTTAGPQETSASSAPRETSRPIEPIISEQVTSEPPRRSEGIHGPSFLGLADTGDPDFLDDIDEPTSHTRRNLLLVALAVVVVLGAVQWRNIRDTGLNFAGSMKLNLPGKKDAQTKPSPEAAATDNHSENGPANDGKPEMVVNPTNGADKAQNSNSQSASNNADAGNSAQQNGAASQPPPDASSSDKADNSTSKKDDGDSAKSDENAKAAESAKASNKKPVEEAKNNAADNSDEDAADSSEDSSPAATEKPAKSATSKSSAAKASKAPSANPAASAGAEELAKASQASSPETAAKWLWASTSKGNLDAPVRLADLYATGRGVSKDCEQATVLLRSSARRGNPRASARLGMYYATGQCVQQDRSQAWHWLSLAHQGDPNSDWIRQYRERLWSQMTADERARAGNGPMSNASE